MIQAARQVRSLFGQETEYALVAFGPDGSRVDPSRAVDALLQVARERLRHLRAVFPSSGLFLENGARLYVDQGDHPELTTPECSDPLELVRYVEAGEELLRDLAVGTLAQPDIASANLFKCNVSYKNGATWGCHESYLHRTCPEDLPHQLLPHLITRIVFAGAGGFDPLSPGIEFSLSPRAAHMEKAVSDSSTQHRGIFHTKDESLCGDPRYHRLHLVCGSSLSTQRARYLKLGTTALVLALVELGEHPGQGLSFAAPVQALKTFAADPFCRVTAPTTCGAQLGAVEVQRRLHERVVSRLDALPDWAPAVCREWARVLDALDQDPASLADRLDWGVKRFLFTRHLQQRGRTWEDVAAWSHVLRELSAGADLPRDVTLQHFITRREQVWPVVRRLTPFLEQHGLHWTELRDILTLRQELFELDLRFGALLGGTFRKLDAAGVLDHRASGLGDVTRAQTEPPELGRAHLRGALVRRLAKTELDYRCDWSRVVDPTGEHYVDLGDPFEDTERWARIEPDPENDDVCGLPICTLEEMWEEAAVRDDGGERLRVGRMLVGRYEDRERRADARKVWRGMADVAREQGDTRAEASFLNNVGVGFLWEGRWLRAIQMIERSLALRAFEGCELANVDTNRWTARYRAQGIAALLPAERILYAHAHTLNVADDWREAKVLALLARLQIRRGFIRDARNKLCRSLVLRRGRDWPWRSEDEALLNRLFSM